MSTQLPRLEAKNTAQERMQTILHARIEELAQDMGESFKQQAAYQVRFEQKVDERFDKVDERFDKVDERFDKVDKRFNAVETRLDTIETTMATKEDIASLEKRMLNAFQQLLTIIDQRLPSQEK